jgi:hypothetical protein
LDIPPTSSDLILHGPPITADDTLVSQNATQTLTNKNLTAGTQINGCGITNGAGTYVCLPNNSGTATLINRLASLSGLTGTVIATPVAATGGIIGIVTAGAGITGNATIQESGEVNCVFDGAVTGGDYVQISPTVTGECHDAGSTYPTSGQVVGQLISSGSGTLEINLFGPEIQAAAGSSSAKKVVFLSPYMNATTSPTFLLVYTGLGPVTMTCQFTWQASAGTAGPKFYTNPGATGTLAFNLSSAVTGSTSAYNSSYVAAGSGTTNVSNIGTVSTGTNLPATLSASWTFTDSESVIINASATGAGTLTIEGGFCIFQ